MPDSGRLRRVVALLLLCALAAGCASLPTEGPVRAGRDVSVEERPELAAPIFAAAPRQGAEPREVVRGFLAAGVDVKRDHETARLYLTPDVRGGWNPQSGTTVYRFSDEASIEVVDPPAGAEAGVRLSADLLGRIDAEGRFAPAPPGERLETVFGLRQGQDSQWRITTPPEGLLLTATEVAESHRRLDLYFLDPDRAVVVPDPVFVPAQAGIVTALVRRLLSGPTSALAPAVTTAFPAGSQLAVASVLVEEGVAEVVLDDAALAAGSEARVQMVAQLVWTLTQLREVTAVRVRAGQSDLGRGDGQGRQTRDLYAAYDPSGLGASSPVVVGGGALSTLVSLGEGDLVPVGGPLGDPALTVARPAISLDGSTVAGLDATGEALLVGRLGSGSEVATRFVGEDLAPPSWSQGPLLYVVDRGGDPGLWVLPRDGEAQRVELPDLGGSSLVAARPSRDGTRMALVLDDPAVPAPAEDLALAEGTLGVGQVVGDRLLVGSIRRAGSREAPLAAVQNLTEIAHEVGTITDLAWAGATEVVVLGDVRGAAAQPVRLSVDGWVVEPTSVLPGLVSITAAPGARPLLGSTSGGEVVQYSGRRWSIVAAGASPAYPG